MCTCLPAVTEALAATPGVASSAGKIPPFWQIPQSTYSVTRGYGFHAVEVNHTHIGLFRVGPRVQRFYKNLSAIREALVKKLVSGRPFPAERCVAEVPRR